jgi:hypothetical protein
MSLSDFSLVDPVDDVPPALASRLESAQSSAHMGIALVLGTFLASPVIVAALTGRQDVVVALALYLVAIVVSWLAVGLFAGAFALAGRTVRNVAAAVATSDAAPASNTAIDIDTDTDVDAGTAADPDAASTTR